MVQDTQKTMSCGKHAARRFIGPRCASDPVRPAQLVQRTVQIPPVMYIDRASVFAGIQADVSAVMQREVEEIDEGGNGEGCEETGGGSGETEDSEEAGVAEEMSKLWRRIRENWLRAWITMSSP